MVYKYKPSSFFKHISNNRLKAILDKFGVELDVDWENRVPQKDESVSAAWNAYVFSSDKKENHKFLQEIFQRIGLISFCVKNRINPLLKIKKSAELGEIKELPEDFDDNKKWTNAERGAYVYLENGLDALRTITERIYLEVISYSDHMIDYQTERLDIVPSPDLKQRLKKAISAFFELSEEDMTQVQLESYPTLETDKNSFFFTKDGDIETDEFKLISENTTAVRQLQRPYTVVFSYDNTFVIKPQPSNNEEETASDEDAPQKSGKPGTKLSLYAENLNAKTRDKLAAVILGVLGNKAPDVARVKKSTYRLDCFAVPNPAFPDMSDFGIKECHVRRIGIIATANEEDEIIFNNTQKNNAYDSFRRAVMWFRNSSSIEDSELAKVYERPFKVSLVSIVMVTISGKVISFDLRKHSCNRHNYPQDICDIIQKLIDRMGIEE